MRTSGRRTRVITMDLPITRHLVGEVMGCDCNDHNQEKYDDKRIWKLLANYDKNLVIVCNLLSNNLSVCHITNAICDQLHPRVCTAGRPLLAVLCRTMGNPKEMTVSL